MKVWVLQDVEEERNVDDADHVSVHATIDGLKRAAIGTVMEYYEVEEEERAAERDEALAEVAALSEDKAFQQVVYAGGYWTLHVKAVEVLP